MNRRVLLHAIASGSVLGSPMAGALMLGGCDMGSGKPKFNNVDITGADFGRNFELTGADGKPHKLADFKGKLVVVFFGFTQCPDVCPTTLAQMAQAVKKLGPDGDRVQVVFITVDPERDSPAVLAQYVPAFDPRFIGLYGNAEQTAKTAREFKVFFEKVSGKSAGSYSIDHTAASYVFDTSGRLRLFVKHDQPLEWIVADLKTLLAAG
jgi:protein SCO1